MLFSKLFCIYVKYGALYMGFIIKEEKRQCRGQVFREELAAHRKNYNIFRLYRFTKLHTRVILFSAPS